MRLAFSDLHFHKYKQFNQDNRRIHSMQDFLRYLFKLADKNGIDTIYFSGDMFNNMEIVYTEAITYIFSTVKCLFDQYPNITIIAISGNHDHATRNTIDNPATSALEMLTVFPNFHLIDDTMTGDAVGEIGTWGIPYYDKPEEFDVALNKMVIDAKGCDYKAKVLLMHQIMGLGISMVDDDIDPKDPRFDVFDYVLNGHIHGHSYFGNGVFNVGSPMHRDASDIGIAKGILALNPLQKDEWQFMDLTDKFPQIVRKHIGDETTEWENDQYILWSPPPVEISEEDVDIREKFTHTDHSKGDLIGNFMDVKKVPKDIEASINTYRPKILQHANSL